MGTVSEPFMGTVPMALIRGPIFVEFGGQFMGPVPMTASLWGQAP